MATANGIVRAAPRRRPGCGAAARAGRTAAAVLAMVACLAVSPRCGAPLFQCPAAGAQEEPGPTDRERLAKEFTDPLTTLAAVFVQDAYSPANYGTEAPDQPSDHQSDRSAHPQVFAAAVRPTRPTEPHHSSPCRPAGAAPRAPIRRHAAVRRAVIPWPAGRPADDGRRAGVRLSDRNLQDRGPECMASGSHFAASTRASLDSCRRPDPEPHLLRLHLLRQPPVSTLTFHQSCSPTSGRASTEIRRLHVDAQLAPRYADPCR